MRLVQVIVLVSFVSMLGSCTGIRVSQDYDPSTNFSNLHTFGWFESERPESGNVHLDNPLIDQRVRRAIVTTLTAKGYRKIEEGTPYFRVNFFLTVDRKIESSGSSYRMGTYGRHGGASVGTGTQIREYKEGTLVIDVLGPGDEDLVWRGSGSKRLSKQTTPEKTTEIVNKVVAVILGQFPPQ